MTDMKLANNGEKLARKALRKHFTNIHYHKNHTDPFDYTATDKLTGIKVAIEVKTTSKAKGKLAHIETQAMERKLSYCNETNRTGIILLIIANGETEFYFARLRQHISRGNLIKL